MDEKNNTDGEHNNTDDNNASNNYNLNNTDGEHNNTDDNNASNNYNLSNENQCKSDSACNYFDYNNASSHHSSTPMLKVMTSKVYEGASGEQTRFNNLQRIIGFWIRRTHDGLITKDDAWEEICSYNQANVNPPWPEDKLKQAAYGIRKVHMKKHQEQLLNSNSNSDSQENKTNCKEDTKGTADTNTKIEAINPSLWQGTPPERKWLIKDWLPRGYVTALYGDGGVGKSLLAQQIVTLTAIGGEFLGNRIDPCRTYALMCEDNEDELWRRQCAINNHLGISMNDLGSIRFVSRVGSNNMLMTFANSEIGKLTGFFHELYNEIISYKPNLVVLDTAADLFGGNENNRPQVRQFIQIACAKFAKNDSAVLLCAHPSESGILKGTGSGGSTAWNNTVRSRWYLKRPEEGELTQDHRILSRIKSNYSQAGDKEYLKWESGAFITLESESCSTPITGRVQNNKNSAERDRKTHTMLQIIRSEAAQGRIYTMNQFAENFEDAKEGKYALGSMRGINERLSIAATQGLIKFFNNPNVYGFDINHSRYHYICTEDMMIKNDMVLELVPVIPTHVKSQCNGKLLRIEVIN